MSTIHRFLGDTTKDHYTWEGVDLMDRRRKTGDGRQVFGPRSSVSCHNLVILHGKAKVQIQDEFHELTPLDAIFISGDDIHQLTNIGETPLGFLCVITRQAEYP